MSTTYSKALIPRAPDLGLLTPKLGDARPVNPKYFKPETWTKHVQNEFGQQQFAKFVRDMVERIWAQTSSADEVRAFAKLLGNEEEWNLLSVGVIVMKMIGAYDRKGPHASHHFHSCLLWQQVNSIIAARQEQVLNKFSLEEWDPVPYDDRIHLRREDVYTRTLFGSSSRGSTQSERLERLKQSFQGCQHAMASALNRPVDQATFVAPTPTPVRPIREDWHVIARDSSSRYRSAGRDHGFLPDENIFHRQVRLISMGPQRPHPPDIPDRIDLFDAAGLEEALRIYNIKNSSTPALPALKDDRWSDQPPRKASVVSKRPTLQPRRHSGSNQRRDSSVITTQPSSAIPTSQRGVPPRPSLRVPSPVQHDPSSTGSRSSRTGTRSSQPVALPNIAELGINEPCQSLADSRRRPTQIKASTNNSELDNTNDCPPDDLLVECGPIAENHKEQQHSWGLQKSSQRQRAITAK